MEVHLARGAKRHLHVMVSLKLKWEIRVELIFKEGTVAKGKCVLGKNLNPSSESQERWSLGHLPIGFSSKKIFEVTSKGVTGPPHLESKSPLDGMEARIHVDASRQGLN